MPSTACPRRSRELSSCRAAFNTAALRFRRSGDAPLETHGGLFELGWHKQAGRWRVVAAANGGASNDCRWQLRVSRTGRPQPPAATWELVAEIKRPTDRDEVTAIYRLAP